MPKMGITVERRVRISREAIVNGVENEVRDAAGKMAVKRAKFYVPVRTGRLKRSIMRLTKNTIGSRVRYAGFVEDGTRFMAARRYIAKALKDVQRAMPSIVRDAMRRVKR